jgi:uncharacterized protein (TIGR03000 family)
MYSMVMMMALSSGAEAPATFHRSSGCYGCYGGGCYGGWTSYRSYGGCYGGGCYGGRISYGGCYGGGCYGGWGTSYSAVSYYGGGCHGGVVSYGGGCHGGVVSYGGGCHGGVVSYGSGGVYIGGGSCTGALHHHGTPGVVVPQHPKDLPGGVVNPPAPVPAPAPAPALPPAASRLTPATLVVQLPAEATLTIEGHATKSTEAERTFVSPPLEPGKTYSYALKATIVRDEKPVQVDRTVFIRAGETTRVQLEFSSLAVAQK